MAKHILIIDDSKSLRSFTRLALEQAGYQVSEAEDGEQALAVIAENKYDAIISDLNMPKVNGIEMIQQIKSDEKYANAKFTPIIMLTTEADESKKQQGQMAGARAWIVKPFVPDQLLSVMKKICPAE